MNSKNLKNTNQLNAKVMKIEVKNDELLGDYIVIGKQPGNDRDSILVKVTNGDEYIIGELVITDRMKVFYNHKKRVTK